MSGDQHLLFSIVLAILCCYFVQLAEAQITYPDEVSALKAIRSRLNDPLGRLNNWNKGDPCTSNWTGIICYNTTSRIDGYLHVQELQLLKMNLSGNLAPELGRFSQLEILDFMWNQLSGNIPKEIGNITTLKLLLLNGNQLSGPLPEELGYFPVLDRIQIDQNHISGSLPKSFANLNKTKHFHMNNNSISGQIPHELSRLPNLVHFLLDNNNLTGHLPPEFSQLPNLHILQLDNNNFSGSSIPDTYGNMTQLFKLSLRNCSLQGSVPDLSGIPQLGYLDLSRNQLTGPIPTNRLSNNITTINLSNNLLNGSIPKNFSGLPHLQSLSLENNQLIGSVPSTIWQNMTFSGNKSLVLDFQNNSLTNISNTLNPPANVSIRLYGNPVCASANQLNITQFCAPQFIDQISETLNNKVSCIPCPADYEYNPWSPNPCSCFAPLGVGYRLKSPGFVDFRPYFIDFEVYLTGGLYLLQDQLYLESFVWEEGPRLKMNLKFFPHNVSIFNTSEVKRITSMFTGWSISDSDIFGPYELLNFTLGEYTNVFPTISKSGLKTGAVIGIVFGAIAAAATFSAVVTILIMRKFSRYHARSKKRSSRFPIKIDGVKDFSFQEMAVATDNFSNSAQVGQGGYGKVYRGVLADGTVVAIKRAQEGSLQGSKEFCTEIELLSRLHHRNLVSLVGYCDEEDEQMLVYEFMPNDSLRDHLSARSKVPLNFSLRLRIALASARGILYLHTEADPPIFHRDIKASNILLDTNFVAKVADFGLSRLAPVPEGEGSAPAHVSTVVKGTPGYLDPEYFLTHKLTDKSDVYSLGVVFLELLTGMQPISHGKNIVREVTMAHESGMIFSVIDSRMGSYPAECIVKFVSLALRCCQDETHARPSMSEVVRELENIWHMVPETDAVPSESMATDSSKAVTPNSSSLPTGNPYLSTDVSGSDLLSSVIPTIAPR